jgi:hypothetical protein
MSVAVIEDHGKFFLFYYIDQFVLTYLTAKERVAWAMRVPSS